jgi:hypothetical protein
MLSLLLDENVSPEIATQIQGKRPDIPIVSIHSWQKGRFLAQPDEQILTAARAEGITLVTYDQKTIMPVLSQWGQIGMNHAGVIFIDHRTIASSDFGGLVRSLTTLWDDSHETAWTNAITYLVNNH